MPCYDGREETDEQKTIQAACEMAHRIMELKQLESLSDETRDWILDHIKLDKEMGRHL